MAFRARKVFGTFEKRAPGSERITNCTERRKHFNLLISVYAYASETTLVSVGSVAVASFAREARDQHVKEKGKKREKLLSCSVRSRAFCFPG